MSRVALTSLHLSPGHKDSISATPAWVLVYLAESSSNRWRLRLVMLLPQITHSLLNTILQYGYCRYPLLVPYSPRPYNMHEPDSFVHDFVWNFQACDKLSKVTGNHNKCAKPAWFSCNQQWEAQNIAMLLSGFSNRALPLPQELS